MPSARPRSSLALALLATGLAAGLATAVPRPYVPGVDVQASNVFLQSPKSILMPSSASGAHLYVTGGAGVVSLRRDVATGTVRFVGRQDVDPSSLSVGEGALSPDGLHLYVPTTSISPFTGVQLSMFVRDPVTGALAAAGGIAVPGGVNAVAVSPDGAHVYATGQALSVFSRDGGTGMLTALGSVAVTNATGVDVSPDGLHVYATRPSDDAITVWARDLATGALTLRGTVADGVGGADGLDGVTDLVVSPDGLHVYAAGELEDAVAAFVRDGTTGLLTFVEAERQGVGGVSGLVRPSGLVLSGDGAHVYAAAGPNAGLGAPGALVAFARDPITGALAPAGTLENGGGVEAIGGPAVGISPDGLHVYAASGAALAVVSRDPVLGTTAFVQRRTGFGGFGLQGAKDLAPTSDGRHVYVASEIDRAVSRFDVSSVDGALVFGDAVYQGEQPGLSGVGVVATSPDGLHVYAASADIDTVAIFARTPTTGDLAYAGEIVDGVAGADGIADPVAMVASPDGLGLYVLGGATASLAAFGRDAGTGALTYVQTLVDGTGGVAGLASPRALAMSPDGASVYVVGGNAVTAFARDPGTNALTFLASIVDGDPGAERLAGARDVVVTPDALQVVVAAEDDDTVVVFDRDPGTGLLVPTATIRDVPGVGALGAPTAVAMHADGATLLVVADAALGGASGSGPALWSFDRAIDGTIGFVSLRGVPDVIRVAHFGAADDAYAIQIGFGLRLYRFSPGFTGCDPLPRMGCKGRADGRAKLVMKVRTPSKPVLKWKWSNGEQTLAADFAGLDASGAAWCLYDESGATPVLLARALAPGDGIRWRAASPTKFKFKDRGRLPEGVLGILMSTSSSSGRAKLKVKGSGPNLSVPTPGLPLPLRAQLQGEVACWEATFSAAGARRNEFGQFIGNAD